MRGKYHCLISLKVKSINLMFDFSGWNRMPSRSFFAEIYNFAFTDVANFLLRNQIKPQIILDIINPTFHVFHEGCLSTMHFPYCYRNGVENAFFVSAYLVNQWVAGIRLKKNTLRLLRSINSIRC